MKISTDQFLARPPKQLAPLYTIFGAEPLLALEAADALRAMAKQQGYVERDVHSVEAGFDWSGLLMAGAAMSLFSSQKLMELRIPTGKPGVEGSKTIEALCNRLPADTVTLVLLPDIDWQGQKSKWFGALERSGTLIEARAIERNALPGWLAARLKLQGQSADAETLDFLADQVEGNLLAAMQEIRKLALLLPPGNVSLKAIQDSVLDVSRFNVGQLSEAIHDADLARLQRILDGLKAEGEAPPLILWVLANECRQLLRLAGATRSGRPMPPKKEQALQRTARRHSKDSLEAALLQAARVDRMIKGLDFSDPWMGLFQLAAALAGKPLLKEAA